MKRAGLARPCARVAIAALITLLSGCATSTETSAANDPATTIDVVERDWRAAIDLSPTAGKQEDAGK